MAPPDPWYEMAVVKSEHGLHLHRYRAARSDHHPDHVQLIAPLSNRHEIDQRRHAGIGSKLGLQNQRLVALAPAYAMRFVLGRNQPTAIVDVAQPIGETATGIKTARAQQVDGAVFP